MFETFFYSHKSSHSFKNYLHWDCWKSSHKSSHSFFFLKNICTGIVGNPTVVSHFFSSHNLAIVSKIICTGIVGNPTVVSILFALTNLAIVSKIICTGIVGNSTVVSHFFSSHRSSHSFKNYLHWDCWKSNRCFNLFFLSQI